jgi:hypothetical protein
MAVHSKVLVEVNYSSSDNGTWHQTSWLSLQVVAQVAFTYWYQLETQIVSIYIYFCVDISVLRYVWVVMHFQSTLGHFHFCSFLTLFGGSYIKASVSHYRYVHFCKKWMGAVILNLIILYRIVELSKVAILCLMNHRGAFLFWQNLIWNP